MSPSRLRSLSVWLLAIACTPTRDPAPATRAEPESPPPPALPVAEVPRAEPRLPAVPSMEDASSVPAVEVLAPAGECPPMPALAKGAPASQRALVPALAVLRQVSCRPEVFGMGTPEALQALAVPKEVPLEFGRRYARVVLPDAVKVRDVLAALGVKGARMRLEQAWRSTWVVGVGEDVSAPRPFGPGVFALRIAGERNDSREHGTIEDIPTDAVVEGGLAVKLPEDAARFADDRFAAPAAVGAIVTLAQDPSLLALEPAQAHARLAMLGERYVLYRYSEGLGDAAFVGFSLRPHRTELRASELAAGLGLEGAAHEQIRITDTNPDRLAYGGKTNFIWHGLELEVELEECPQGGPGLAGWCVDGIQILPTKRP